METKNAVVIFEDLPIRKVEKDGQQWISVLDVAKALGYNNPSQDSSTIISRNPERFKDYSTLINLITVEGKREVKRKSTFLNIKGVIAFCMLSNKEKALPFQRWADTVLEKELSSIPADIRIIAKKKRIEFTDELKSHGYNKPVEYATTTKHMKENLGIEKKKSDCDLIEVMKIATAEMLAKTKIMIEDKRGFNEIDPLCIESAKVIKQNTLKNIE